MKKMTLALIAVAGCIMAVILLEEKFGRKKYSSEDFHIMY